MLATKSKDKNILVNLKHYPCSQEVKASKHVTHIFKKDTNLEESVTVTKTEVCVRCSVLQGQNNFFWLHWGG